MLLSTLGQSYVATAARSEGIIWHIKLTTSCTQSRNKCTAHQWKPCLSSAHGEDGRGTWAQCKGRSSSENTMQRHHVTLFHACSNRKQYRWFSLPTVAYQMQCVHINQCVRNALKYQSHGFLGHRTTHGPLAITHGKNGTGDKCA